MALISGKQGQVKRGGVALAAITHWTLRTSAKNKAYSSSATGGFRRRLPGVRQAEGKFTFKLSATSPQIAAIDEGDLVTLDLVVAGEAAYVIPAAIDHVELEVNIQTGEPIGGIAHFSSDGPWTKLTFGD